MGYNPTNYISPLPNLELWESTLSTLPLALSNLNSTELLTNELVLLPWSPLLDASRSFTNITLHLLTRDDFDVFEFAYGRKTGVLYHIEYDAMLELAALYTNEDGIDERYTFKYTLAKSKLAYPEPFIASPSYNHPDLYILCILQYWYWLWFIFISLIMLFFIAFIINVRWCATHKKPVRETQGVSRSKCGDLITACVPVSWAASIIIGESTDAADVNDGFGTGEIVVGVRAYQWGWEYYYPRAIDLNYNVKSTYSSFIGNSLKYNYDTGLNATSNNLWRQYQVKPQDSSLTPASLVFNSLGASSNGAQNFAENVGVDSLKLSASFPKIRNNTKIYNTHLVNQPTASFDKTYRVASLFSKNSETLGGAEFSITRPSNLVSATSQASGFASLNGSAALTALPFLAETETFSENEALHLGLTQPELSTSTALRTTKVESLEFPTLSDSSDGIVQTDQSIQQQKFSNPVRSSDLSRSESNRLLGTNLYQNVVVESSEDWYAFHASHSDYVTPLATRGFAKTPLPPVLSSSKLRSNSGRSLIDGTVVSKSYLNGSSDSSINTTYEANTVIAANVGLIEKIPQSLINLYWSTCWANLNPTLRWSHVPNTLNLESTSYLPSVEMYADYDFRNDQSLMLLEDLFWELPYSSYDFYDFMALADSCSSTKDRLKYISELTDATIPTNTATDSPWSRTAALVQSNRAFTSQNTLTAFPNPSYLGGVVSGKLALISDVSADDNALFESKGTSLSSLSNLNINPISTTSLSKSFTPSTKTHNNFLSTHEDFTSTSTLSNELPEFLSVKKHHSNSTHNSSSTDSALEIRPAVRDSIVNANAFQKVFRSRLDEGRAHINASNFANLSLTQPFIKDKSLPYTSLLGKNRSSFYQTPVYARQLSSSLGSLQDLYTHNNTPMFDFPFMDALQSDLIRYTWLDGYSKWRYTEVQPASVSKYSLVGVPYLRKPFDFNTNTGDQLSGLQSYFTRSSRARKNYLSNWAYSPIFFNRVSTLAKFPATLASFSINSPRASSTDALLDSVQYLKKSRLYPTQFSDSLNASVSGNTIHQKSTWRPQAGTAAYHFESTLLVDILTKREHLTRDFLLSRKGASRLPLLATASPLNPLLKVTKAAFGFNDPLTFNSEHSRDYIYTSAQYFKFLKLKSSLLTSGDNSPYSPVNAALVNDYTFLYFLYGNTVKGDQTSELYRNQYRPLRKGVNSLLRYHATGAVAMPIEVRIQILASSKDVIHSWSIPSAGIKIDCIPGYTSHRIMKFMLTGIYWGQCQEICGRYHHWMPIVVYFVNRDLFFLWCTHFVYKPQRPAAWEISDRKFANFLRFVSYDRATWLTELSDLR